MSSIPTLLLFLILIAIAALAMYLMDTWNKKQPSLEKTQSAQPKVVPYACSGDHHDDEDAVEVAELQTLIDNKNGALFQKAAQSSVDNSTRGTTATIEMNSLSPVDFEDAQVHFDSVPMPDLSPHPSMLPPFSSYSGESTLSPAPLEDTTNTIMIAPKPALKFN